MKCPRCGAEMSQDSHRKYAMNMCYECGYVEGRETPLKPGLRNFERIGKLNFNELAAFMSSGLGLSDEAISTWLNSVA